MGFVEDVMALELDDDMKADIIAKHKAEHDPLKEDHDKLVASSRKDKVETEIAQLSDMGFKEAPGLLAWTRRVLLSPDAEEPGAVLLSDSELGLSGDKASGATGREEMSGAAILRKFIQLLPKNEEGKLKVELSEQVDTGDHEKPEGEDDPDKIAAEAAARRERLTGRPLDRKAVRSKRYRQGTVIGGD
jgi:hypothetical protein